jgi:hypothetical protein
VVGLVVGNDYAWSQTDGLPTTLARWMDFEQFRNERIVYHGSTMAPLDVSEVSPNYLPERGQYFPLRSLWVPAGAATLFQVATPTEGIHTPNHYRTVMTRRHAGRDYVRFLVHPQSEQLYHDLLAAQTPTSRQLGLFDGDPLEGTPTSSIRTLLVRRPSQPRKSLFFVKLSLDASVAGLHRVIQSNEVVSSIGQYQYWQALEGILKTPLTAIPEVFSMIPKHSSQGGHIVRLIPPDVHGGRTTLLPLFSLHHKKDSQAGRNTETILHQLARAHNIRPEQFVVRYIIRPFVQAWARWVLLANLTFESHAQNLLLELEPTLNGSSEALRATGRLYIRDLDSLSINTIDPIFLPQARSLLRLLPIRDNFATDYDQTPQQVCNAERTSLIFMAAYLRFLDEMLELPLRTFRGSSGRVYGLLVRSFYTLLTSELEHVARRMMLEQAGHVSQVNEVYDGPSFIPSPALLADMPEAIPVILSSLRNSANHPMRNSFTELCSDTLTKR